MCFIMIVSMSWANLGVDVKVFFIFKDGEMQNHISYMLKKRVKSFHNFWNVHK